jgi:hypothetical protein
MARPIKPARGKALPQTKLERHNVVDIKSMATQRENLKRHIRENLSNDAIAKKFNVHIRTVEKIMALKTWSNI